MAKLLYFGRLTDITGTSSETLPLAEITTTTALRKALDDTYGASGALLEPSVRIAINNEMVAEPATVNDEDEIAFMPPVGGG